MNKVAWQASVYKAAGGAIAPLALVQIKHKDGTDATVWSEREGVTEIDNPLTTDDSGFAVGYLRPGLYDVVITLEDVSRTLEDVLLPAETADGTVQWLEVSANLTLTEEHKGVTLYLTTNNKVLTVPAWASTSDGYAVEVVVASGVTGWTFAATGGDTIRDSKVNINGDCALTKSPVDDLWLTVGNATA